MEKMTKKYLMFAGVIAVAYYLYTIEIFTVNYILIVGAIAAYKIFVRDK